MQKLKPIRPKPNELIKAKGRKGIVIDRNQHMKELQAYNQKDDATYYGVSKETFTEVSTLADNLGIRLEIEGPKYFSYLKDLISYDLPRGWQKETDPNHKVIYHNKETGISSYSHPLIEKFKIIYNDKVKSDLIDMQTDKAKAEEENQIKEKYS